MNETDARAFLLVRAIESTDAERRIWSDEDRAWATRAAAEVVGSEAPAGTFLARRAELALERLGGRHASVLRAARIATWRPWIGWASVAFALIAGVAVDQIGAGRRVNVLALPLLGLLAWNLLAYVLVAARSATAAAGRFDLAGPLRGLIGRLGHATLPVLREREPLIARALGRFAADWTSASLPLAAARVSRILHLAALAFAIGVLAGMYARGMVMEYRAGWESTFLDAPAVSRILHVVLGPASQLTGIALPDVARLEAMRLPQGEGERAAPWLHLYAVTVGLFVLLPRAVLALVAGVLAQRRAARFFDAGTDVYAQRLERQLRGDASRVQLLPYAMSLSSVAGANLAALMARVYGAKAVIEVGEAIAWGAEEGMERAAIGEGATALWVLFPASATPERENHGTFISALRGRLGRGVPLLALVDESAFRKRFADIPARLTQRRVAWQALMDEYELPVVFVDLEAPDLPAAESAANAAVERGARGAA